MPLAVRFMVGLNILMFILEAPTQARKTRAELMKDIDADYYGYRDEDDGVLIPLEMGQEKEGKFSIAMIFLSSSVEKRGVSFYRSMLESFSDSIINGKEEDLP